MKRLLNLNPRAHFCALAVTLWLALSASARPHPPDLVDDIPWTPEDFDSISVIEIESAFNRARAEESAQLGLKLPYLEMPSQKLWERLQPEEQALFLINDERQARGVPPLEELSPAVSSVADRYAEWLLSRNRWGHVQDWNGDSIDEDSWDRLHAVPEIGDCHDFLGIAENLSVFVSSGPTPDEVIARSIYDWTYDDSGSDWGHRHALLWDSFTDNSGRRGAEGSMGIGVAFGGPYRGPFQRWWPTAAIIVWNVYDPCGE